MKIIRLILLSMCFVFGLYILVICVSSAQKIGTMSNEILEEKQELGY